MRKKRAETIAKDPYAPSVAHLEMVERNAAYTAQLRANLQRWKAYRDRVWLGDLTTPIDIPAQSVIVESDFTYEAPAHHCHAIGCSTACPPEYLMCPHHWRMVSAELQRKVWDAYRPGQCNDKQYSTEWFHASNAAIVYVRATEDGSLLRELRDITTRTEDALARCRERLDRAIPRHIREDADRAARAYNERFPLNSKGGRDNAPPLEKHPPVYITSRRETPF